MKSLMEHYSLLSPRWLVQKSVGGFCDENIPVKYIRNFVQLYFDPNLEACNPNLAP
jgi:hypothetical protein